MLLLDLFLGLLALALIVLGIWLVKSSHPPLVPPTLLCRRPLRPFR